MNKTKLLKKIVTCKTECNDCDGTGIQPDTNNDACRYCGGYGFNVEGDIREYILDIERCLDEEEPIRKPKWKWGPYGRP